jgi:hypothetical protein
MPRGGGGKENAGSGPGSAHGGGGGGSHGDGESGSGSGSGGGRDVDARTINPRDYAAVRPEDKEAREAPRPSESRPFAGREAASNVPKDLPPAGGSAPGAPSPSVKKAPSIDILKRLDRLKKDSDDAT